MAHGTKHEAATNSCEPVETTVHGDRHTPQTVTEMVLNLADRHDRGPTFLDDKLTPRAWTFARVIEQAKRHAAFLRAHQIQPGERIALIVIDSQDFMPAFFGTIFAGAVPVPMPVPVSTRALSSYVDNCRRIMTTASCSAAFIPRMMANIAADAFTGLPELRCVLQAEDVPTQGPADFEPVRAKPSDTCFLQFTSGSTSTPKGVIVTHANLIANSHAIMHGWLNAGPDDIGASWLPLFHDMGLIGFVIAPLLTATPVVFIPTLSFVQRPSVWMNVVHTYRATISVSPNFGFALAVKRARDVEALDLSRLRVIGCGAEPVNPDTLNAFSACYARGGLGPNVISPLYGLAEATLLASCRTAGEPLRVVELDKRCFEEESRAAAARAAETATIRFAGCGRTMAGHEIQIQAPDGTQLPEGSVGEIVLFGPSCSPGYFGLEPAHKPGLFTGDLGFLLDGELFIAGRKKDLLVLYGRNLYPQAIEWEVEQIPGLRRGTVVAFSVPGKNKEELVVLAEATGNDGPELEAQIRVRLAETMSLPTRAARVLPNGSIPKTSSGKLQRAQARDLWLRGAFDEAPAAAGA